MNTRLTLDLGVMRRLGATMIVFGAALPHVAHNPGLPCPLRTLTGVPCPLCGMTTSVKATCTGRLSNAVTANPFGILAVAVAFVLLIRPKWATVRVPVAVLIGAAVVSWGWELHRFHWV